MTVTTRYNGRMTIPASRRSLRHHRAYALSFHQHRENSVLIGLTDRLLELQKAVLLLIQLTMLRMTTSIVSLLLSIHCLLRVQHQSLLRWELRLLLQCSSLFLHLLLVKVTIQTQSSNCRQCTLADSVTCLYVQLHSFWIPLRC